MNTEEFVQGVFAHMLAGVRGDIEYIQSPPPGRKPLQRRMEMHKWYSNLSDADKETVHRLIHDTYEGAVYGLLMVLDHKMFVEDIGPKGELELYYRAPSGERVHLNPLGGDKGGDLESYFKAIRDDARVAEPDRPESS